MKKILLVALALSTATLIGEPRGRDRDNDEDRGRGRGNRPEMNQPGPNRENFQPRNQPGPRVTTPAPQPRVNQPNVNRSQPNVNRSQPNINRSRPYIGVNPNERYTRSQPSRTYNHRGPSHWESRYSRDNYKRAYDRSNDFIKRHDGHRDWISSHNDGYRRTYVPKYERRRYDYHRHPAYANYYNRYYRYGFLGGYYYPVRPFLNFDRYFYYPIAYWLFGSGANPGYYTGYYGTDVQPWRYAGVFYPTDTLRDLAVDVSGMENSVQAVFRDSMTTLMDMLSKRISELYRVQWTVDSGDVVITHYENLQNVAIVIEGFVDQDSTNIHLPFKALLDLQDASQTMLFMPGSTNPTQTEIQLLNVMNRKIQDLGGDPYAAHREPLPR